MRGRMSDAPSYAIGIGHEWRVGPYVVTSNVSGFAKGDIVGVQ